MAVDAFSWYCFTTNLVCATSLLTVVARNESPNVPCENRVSSISSVSEPLRTYFISVTSKLSRSNAVIFVAGGLTSLPAFKRSVPDTDLKKTVDSKASRFPDFFTGLVADLTCESPSEGNRLVIQRYMRQLVVVISPLKLTQLTFKNICIS